ncbi:MAG: PaaI family thioesterase [Candidatus Geothermincolia bacterium]
MTDEVPLAPEEVARYEAIAAERLNSSPYYQLIGMQLEELGRGYSRFRLPVKEGLHNVAGIVHGGAIASVADAAMGVALATLLDPFTERPVTVEMKINYLAPVTSGVLIAEGRVAQKGSSLTVTRGEVSDGEGRPVALAMATFLTKTVGASGSEPRDAIS